LNMEYSHSIGQSSTGETVLAASIAAYPASPDRGSDSENCCDIEVSNAHPIFSQRNPRKISLELCD